MISDLMRTMYRYNSWANARILATAERLTSAQFVGAGAAGSIAETLAHTMNVQWLYLERWQGRSPRTWPEPARFDTLAALRARWATIERDTAGFVSALTDARLGETVAYHNMRGERWAYPLWQQMLHQVNHATQHRSEAAAQLTAVGHSPGDLDLLLFIDAEQAAR